ncbi:MAG: ABC transporter permease [Acidimicrobiales bacterium]|nr:ABC transporter permease [Acidimicrobiales bacterium]
MSTSAGITEPRGWFRRVLQANAWLVYAFFYLPIVLLVIYSFSDNRNVGVWGGATLDWYREFANDEPIKTALGNSLKIAAASTTVSVVLGTMAALALERYKFRGRGFFDALLYLPVIIPDVTMAVMMLLFFAEAAKILGFSRGFSTITLSHIAFSISFVSIVVRARLAGTDEKLEEAAMDLYASRWQAFRYVTLPTIMPGVLGGGLLALTLSLDDVVITQFVTGGGWNTLPVYVFGLIRKGVTPLINAVSVVMLVASTVLVGLSLLAQRIRGGEPV